MLLTIIIVIIDFIIILIDVKVDSNILSVLMALLT